jgi:hypothetical protein
MEAEVGAVAEGQVFRNVSPEQFARLREKARAAGIEIEGNSGSASKFGAEVAWNYNADTQELNLQVLSAPFFMKKEDLEEQMRGLVEKA